MKTPFDKKPSAPAAAPGSHEHPGAPVPRTGLGHTVDTVSLVGYFAAIGLAAMFLNVPHPWIAAGGISVACLLAIGTRRRMSA